VNVQEAIMAFSQSEKIKTGLIWITQSLELFSGLDPAEQQGAEKIIKATIQMVNHEVTIADRLTDEPSWKDIAKHIDTARVMIYSGIPPEATFHLTRALTHVTSIGQRSMTFLKEQGFL
jgi:hypothetical protein